MPVDSSMTEMVVEEFLKPGTKVEVRSRFGGKWSRGFEVAEVLADAYRVRRLSDGSVIPAEFCFEDVRRERRQGMWWA